jgi:PTS system nitrogen regulatory IIA component
MQLTVREASTLLNLPEKELYRLIKRNEIPHLHLNKSFFFNKAELLEWAIARSINISPDFFTASDIALEKLPLLSDAIEKGGLHFLAGGEAKAGVLQKIVSLFPGIGAPEQEPIFKAIMARETLGSTGIGNGIAIPHVRNPIILNIKEPSILLCFLENPIDFDALDGQKVSTIFTMISPTARIHLHLLARLSFLLQNKDIRKVLSFKSPAADIITRIRTAENRMVGSPPKPVL